MFWLRGGLAKAACDGNSAIRGDLFLGHGLGCCASSKLVGDREFRDPVEGLDLGLDLFHNVRSY